MSAEDDYRSFCDALSSTARGRAFLEEFSRRNRQADTETVLNALNRLEATALSHAATSPEADRIRQDLRALLDTLRTARPQTENSPTAIKAATLAALIDFAQARIESLVMPVAVSEGEMLAAVPAPEQPELPIPHPAATAAPIMALVPPAPPPAEVQASAPALMPAQAASPIGLQVSSPLSSDVSSQVSSQVSSPAKRKIAAVIPTVEFDYRMHQAVRPAPVRSAPEEAWSTLAPPVISAPAYAAPLPSAPVIAEPAPAPVAEAASATTITTTTDVVPQTDAGAETKIKTAAVEPYELWLDPPAVAAAEPEKSQIEALTLTVDFAVAELTMPAQAVWTVSPSEFLPAADVEAVTANVIADEAAIIETAVIETTMAEASMTEETMADTVVAETIVAATATADLATHDLTTTDIAIADTTIADSAMTDAPLAVAGVANDTPVHDTAGATMATIEQLMQQMEKSAAPAVRGHAEADPLAPIMALSEEERIALFT